MTEIAALGVSIQIALDAQRNIVFQTHIAGDASEAEINDLLDKGFKAADRKIAHYEIKRLEGEVDTWEKTLRQLGEDLERVDEMHRASYANRKGELKLTQSQQQERNNVLGSVGRYKDEIRVAKEKIARLQHAFAGATNNNTRQSDRESP